MPEAVYLRTPARKRARAARRGERPEQGSADTGSEDEVLGVHGVDAPRAANEYRVCGVDAARRHTISIPVVAYLRKGNIVGGGFHLTSTDRLPQIVRVHVQAALSEISVG